MHERARSAADKAQRSEDLLNAAESLAQELGGVRFVTVAAVTERAGLHRTGVRRYYASKEELLLELAERGWRQWRDLICSAIDGRTALSPLEVGTIVADTLASMSTFCDLQGHVAMSLEGDVDIERARRYKTNATGAHDELVKAIGDASTLTRPQIQTIVATATVVAAGLWQTSHPTPTLAQLYEQEPSWAHAALDFEPRVRLIVQAVAMGIDGVLPSGSSTEGGVCAPRAGAQS